MILRPLVFLALAIVFVLDLNRITYAAFLTGNWNSQSNSFGESDPIEDECDDVLAPEDVLRITAASH